MREQGWTGGRVEERRRAQEMQMQRTRHIRTLRDQLSKTLEIDPRWWGDEDEFASEEASDEEDGDREDFDVYVSVLSIPFLAADVCSLQDASTRLHFHACILPSRASRHLPDSDR